MLTLANILYVLVSVAMIVMILLQRGAGAAAGSGFGSGASGTVFGARGAANFLSKSTAVLATLFFVISLGMAIYASRGGKNAADDLGVMGAVPAEVPAEVPAATSDVPAAEVVVPAASDVPAATVDSAADGAASTATEVEVETQKSPSE
ncbi:MAG TPA: preprotein translocase subunit SecG [Aquimonas sp.]|jgi:preprotein translocase subunit SecG|nr:preprotein translocase subunit SecG [Xanthomonadales bacterium]HRF53865.1 preprotein translocase subunit SecG [Aquimonas sp.]